MDLISQGDALLEMPLREGEHARLFTAARFSGLECLSARFSTHTYSPHAHETYAVGTILSGCELWHARGRARFASPTSHIFRKQTTELAGWRGWCACLACLLPMLLGFILPAIVLTGMAYGMSDGPGLDRLAVLTVNTGLLGLLAGLVIVAVAIVAILIGNRGGSAATYGLLRAAALGYAVPGSVIGVGILIVVGAFDATADRLMRALTGGGSGLVLGGTIAALLYAYLCRFFAVGFNPLQAGMAKIAPSMGDAARVLGCGPIAVAGRIHLPLLRPALLSAVLLVLVDVMKELPATLILRPFNFDTLAVEAFQLATTERLDGAALPSLIIVVVGLLPVILLCRMLDRGRGAGAV